MVDVEPGSMNTDPTRKAVEHALRRDRPYLTDFERWLAGEIVEAVAVAAVETLNRVHAADPTVLPALIDHRVPCNEAVADDTTVQVGQKTPAGPGQTEPVWEVGLLGVINGILGVRPGTPGLAHGWVEACYDDTGALLHFDIYRPNRSTTPDQTAV